MTSATAAGSLTGPAAPKSRKSVTGTRRTVAALAPPALVLLGALVVYPIGYSPIRSLTTSPVTASPDSTTTRRCSPTTASAPR